RRAPAPRVGPGLGADAVACSGGAAGDPRRGRDLEEGPGRRRLLALRFDSEAGRVGDGAERIGHGEIEREGGGGRRGGARGCGGGGLPAGIAGWDWFGIQLDGGGELMLYRMRAKDGSATPFSSGTWVPKEGPPRFLRWRDVWLAETATWKSPKTGARYPSAWKIAVAPAGLEVAVVAV